MIKYIFCSDGVYCCVSAGPNLNYKDGDYKEHYFAAWYPYIGLESDENEFKIYMPAFQPATLNEMEAYEKGLKEFIDLLRNPPNFQPNKTVSKDADTIKLLFNTIKKNENI